MTPALPTGPTPVASAQVSPAAPAPAPQPAPPAQSSSSLLGQWRMSGSVWIRNLASPTPDPTRYTGCHGMATIDTHDGRSFSGRLNSNGSSLTSDKHCMHYLVFAGLMASPDGGATELRFDRAAGLSQWPMPSAYPACEVVVPATVWTGTATLESISVAMADTIRCPASVEGGVADMPMADFERRVTLTFTRWP